LSCIIIDTAHNHDKHLLLLISVEAVKIQKKGRRNSNFEDAIQKAVLESNLKKKSYYLKLSSWQQFLFFFVFIVFGHSKQQQTPQFYPLIVVHS
jgi:hypothetical protein